LRGWIGPTAASWQFVLGIGMACAVTALPVLILLMEKLEILRKPIGQRIMRYASIDDVMIWAVLALILMDWQRVGRQAGFLMALALASWPFRSLMRRLPERGQIGIFNRSYYEEVLVVRVHPEVLKNSRIPPSLLTKDIWKDRFQDINCFDRYLTRNGIVVRKFFLNLSKKEQKKRFLDRLDRPGKNWKFSEADVRERGYWDDYMKAYEDMIINTSSPQAPWYVIPADNKWFTHAAVAAAIVETLEDLKLAYPKVDAAKRKELKVARAMLEGKKTAKTPKP